MAGLGHLQPILADGLWHTTRPDRVLSIIRSGFLLVEPAVENKDRWKTSRGPDFYPFVRTIGGVSLFDFAGFDADAYDRSHPMSSWHTFVPYIRNWGGAVWIEIDRHVLGDRFLTSEEVLNRWQEGGYHRHTLMPRIEAAHLGDMPISTFKSAFLTWKNGLEVRSFNIQNFDENEYRVIMKAWETGLSVIG